MFVCTNQLSRIFIDSIVWSKDTDCHIEKDEKLVWMSS